MSDIETAIVAQAEETARLLVSHGWDHGVPYNIASFFEDFDALQARIGRNCDRFEMFDLERAIRERLAGMGGVARLGEEEKTWDER